MSLSEPAINRFGFAILTVALWILGLGAIEGGGFYDPVFSYYFDFGEYHTALGIVLLGLGLLAAYQVFRRR
jgi:hypothetical protein